LWKTNSLLGWSLRKVLEEATILHNATFPFDVVKFMVKKVYIVDVAIHVPIDEVITKEKAFQIFVN